jgi:hypothetical protein
MADTAILERLIADDYLQEQLGAGASRLGAAYRRARSVRAEQAVQDQRVYDHVRGAVEALIAAGRRALGKPQPEPKRRSRLPALLVAAAVAGVVWKLHRAQQQAPGAATGERVAPRYG